MAALILRREDGDFDEQNPSGIMKILAMEDIKNADYNETEAELTLSFRELDTFLTIHVPLSLRSLTPELARVLDITPPPMPRETINVIS
jgi:hypothetical protein